MTTFTSHGGFVIYGKQTSSGTAVAPTATVPFPRTSEWTISNQLIEVDSIGRAEPADLLPGFADVRCNFEAYLTPYDHNWFGYVLGRRIKTTVSDAVTQFKAQCAATNNSATITFYTGVEESSEAKVMIEGCRPDSLTFTARAGEVVTYSVNLIGRQPTLSTTATKPSFVDIQPFIFADGYVKARIGSDSLATIANIEEINFTINNNLEQLPSINKSDGRVVHEIAQNQRRIAGEMTIRFENLTYQQWVMGGSGSNTPENTLATISVDVYLEQNKLIPGASATNYSCHIYMPKVKFGEGGFRVGTNEILTYRIPFSAFYDSSDTAITVTIENEKDDWDE